MSFLGTKKEFVEKYGGFIKQVTAGTGILPGTLTAQAIIESSGKYNNRWLVGGSKLSRKANNFFGIKCAGGWTGDTYNINTGEYSSSGSKYTVNACFRKYNSVEDSIKDYINFLQKNTRYKNAGVFEAKTVYDQARALKKAGYATAPNYANVISSVYKSISGYLGVAKKKFGIIKPVLIIGSALLIYNYRNEIKQFAKRKGIFK
jgi:flagellum-specific peptidoglycan hydrolase FlgJ